MHRWSTAIHWIVHGVDSFLAMVLFPFGSWWCKSIDHLQAPDRLDRGCIFLLSGIQGKSPVEFSVARGLIDAGIDLGIRIHEWTTGYSALMLFHLRDPLWHQLAAVRLVREISDYQRNYPNRPVFIIGHSGGGGLALMAAARLPDENRVTSVFALGPAISPFFDYRDSLNKTTHGILHVTSPLDIFFLCLGTLCAGTMDRWHWFSAGAIGFRRLESESEERDERCKLVELKYRLSMARYWNFGGHFGYSSRIFVENVLGARILQLLKTIPETASSEYEVKP